MRREGNTKRGRKTVDKTKTFQKPHHMYIYFSYEYLDILARALRAGLNDEPRKNIFTPQRRRDAAAIHIRDHSYVLMNLCKLDSFMLRDFARGTRAVYPLSFYV